MATATDYLPEAIGGYLRLPRQWADSRPVDRGKTSLMMLIDQLDLLGATMDKVFDAVNRADAAALIAHGRFLEEKFGHCLHRWLRSVSRPTCPAPPAPSSRTRRTTAGRAGPAAATGGTMSTLADALDALLAVAERAGVPAETARSEALALAAAVAESAPGRTGRLGRR